jgi:hypothetical protein
MKAWLAENRLPLAAFLIALVAYGAVAGDRLRRRSSDPHFIAQADAWLHGRLDIAEWPAGADDPAKVEEVRLDDGSVVRGRRLTTRATFRVAGGGEIPQSRVKETVRTVSYNSFPPFPAVLLLPQALVHGPWANDVALTVILAALVPAFLLVLLRRLRAAGLSARAPDDDVWLAVLLAFGSVLFFSSVQGRVWFTAHVVAVLLSVLYVWALVDLAHPVLAGVLLGCAVGTRPQLAVLGLLFLFELRRTRARPVPALARFAAPLVVIGVVLAWYNLARFGELAEFGHSYLAVRQQAQIERFGLFNTHYLARNLAVAWTLLPEFSLRAPFITISGHGLAFWFTTPAFLLVLWPRARGPWHRPLWLCVAGIAAASLLYQNSGWIQFGYRFLLDYAVLLVVLLALGEQPLASSRLARALIVIGVIVNLFGAITFHRFEGFYRTDGATYDCVAPH